MLGCGHLDGLWCDQVLSLILRNVIVGLRSKSTLILLLLKFIIFLGLVSLVLVVFAHAVETVYRCCRLLLSITHVDGGRHCGSLSLGLGCIG